MSSAAYPTSPDSDAAAKRRRMLSFVLTVAAHLLILLLLLRLAGPVSKPPGSGGRLVTFNIGPEAQEQTTPAPTPTRRVRQASAAAPAPAVAPPPPKVQLPNTTAAPWVLTPGLESFNVAQVQGNHAAATPAQGDAESADAGADSQSVYGPSGGAGSERLYNADWYREPTGAELDYYLPKNRTVQGWAMIACQTVARFHVDNCRALGETPGTGLAEAIRQAAWQFLVRPPRIGGRSMVGAWVRIRIDFTDRAKKQSGDSDGN